MWCIIWCYNTYLHWKILVNVYFSKKQKIVPIRIREAPVLWGEIKAHDRKDPLSPITTVSIHHQTSALCTNMTWPDLDPSWTIEKLNKQRLPSKPSTWNLQIFFCFTCLVLWSVEEEDHDCLSLIYTYKVGVCR